jgi:hypothetical protein
MSKKSKHQVVSLTWWCNTSNKLKTSKRTPPLKQPRPLKRKNKRRKRIKPREKRRKLILNKHLSRNQALICYLQPMTLLSHRQKSLCHKQRVLKFPIMLIALSHQSLRWLSLVKVNEIIGKRMYLSCKNVS